MSNGENFATIKGDFYEHKDIRGAQLDEEVERLAIHRERCNIESRVEDIFHTIHSDTGWRNHLKLDIIPPSCANADSLRCRKA